MTKYYYEKKRMIGRFKSYWLTKIVAGVAVSYDEIMNDADEQFQCSTKPLIEYIERFLRTETKIVRDGSYLQLSLEEDQEVGVTR